MATVNSEVLEVLQDVSNEVTSAMDAHGPMRSRHEAFGVIAEELDEFWDEVKANPAKMTDAQAVAWLRRQRKELIQTAAMCVRAIVDLELPPAVREVLNPPGPTQF
jgi:hypothetical protein